MAAKRFVEVGKAKTRMMYFLNQNGTDERSGCSLGTILEKKKGKKKQQTNKNKKQRVCCEKECTSPRQLELLFKVSNDISEKVTMDSLRLTARNSRKYEVFSNFVLIKLSICIKE